MEMSDGEESVEREEFFRVGEDEEKNAAVPSSRSKATRELDAAPDCDNCPRPTDKGEWYNFIAAVFDVKRAREIVADGREAHDLTPANLKALMLPIEPPQTNTNGSFTLHMGCGISERHLSHLPESCLTEPCILLPYRIWSKREKNDVSIHIMIDGSHRAVRLHREGRPVQAYMLTEKEAASICTNREPHWWKGLRVPKKRAAGAGRGNSNRTE